MSEKWEKYDVPEIEKSYGKADFTKIFDDEHGLRIELIFESGSVVQFVFEKFVLSYNVYDEGKRLRMLNFLASRYGADMLGEYPVYMVENSEYLKWFNAESYDILSGYDIKHYAFLTSNDIVDVLTVYTPEVKRSV